MSAPSDMHEVKCTAESLACGRPPDWDRRLSKLLPCGPQLDAATLRPVHALASCASRQAIHSSRPSTVTWWSWVPSRWRVTTRSLGAQIHLVNADRGVHACRVPWTITPSASRLAGVSAALAVPRRWCLSLRRATRDPRRLDYLALGSTYT